MKFLDRMCTAALVAVLVLRGRFGAAVLVLTSYLKEPEGLWVLQVRHGERDKPAISRGAEDGQNRLFTRR